MLSRSYQLLYKMVLTEKQCANVTFAACIMQRFDRPLTPRRPRYLANSLSLSHSRLCKRSDYGPVLGVSAPAASTAAMASLALHTARRWHPSSGCMVQSHLAATLLQALQCIFKK